MIFIFINWLDSFLFSQKSLFYYFLSLVWARRQFNAAFTLNIYVYFKGFFLNEIYRKYDVDVQIKPESINFVKNTSPYLSWYLHWALRVSTNKAQNKCSAYYYVTRQQDKLISIYTYHHGPFYLTAWSDKLVIMSIFRE